MINTYTEKTKRIKTTRDCVQSVSHKIKKDSTRRLFIWERWWIRLKRQIRSFLMSFRDMSMRINSYPSCIRKWSLKALRRIRRSLTGDRCICFNSWSVRGKRCSWSLRTLGRGWMSWRGVRSIRNWKSWRLRWICLKRKKSVWMSSLSKPLKWGKTKSTT